MIRVLLFLLFLLLLVGDAFGLNVGLAPGVSTKNAFLYLLLLALSVETALARNRDVELVSVVAPYTLYFVYALITWLFAIFVFAYPRYDALQALITLKGGILDHVIVLLVFFYGLLSRDKAKDLLKAILWVVLVTNILSVIDTLNVPNLSLVGEPFRGRIVGFIGEPNQYAAFLVTFIPGLCVLAMHQKGAARALAVVGVAASIIALFMTISRGGLVGLIAGGVLGAFFLRAHISGRKVRSVIVGVFFASALGVIVLFAAGSGDLFVERTVDVSSSGNAFDVTSGRTYIWGSALSKMLEQPATLLFGYGWEAYRNFPDFYFAPHNSYLKIFFEVGALGLVLVWIAFISVLRIARAGLAGADKESAAYLIAFCIGFLAFLIAIVFVDLATPWVLVWAYVGLALRIAASKKTAPVKDRRPSRPSARELEVGA